VGELVDAGLYLAWLEVKGLNTVDRGNLFVQSCMSY
jgi:hypothetical protein